VELTDRRLSFGALRVATPGCSLTADIAAMPNSERILLVEDHADTAAALFQILTQRGYSVLIADNGQQALDLLDRGIRPRLILIDLMLPRVSGWELLTYLQGDLQLRNTPTVVITGVPKDQVRVIADAVFSKPLDFETLASKIDDLVARHH
jgi:CheY-like chemotaxis protein